MQKEVKEEQASGAEMPRSLACNHTHEDFPSLPFPLAPLTEHPSPKLQADGDGAGKKGASGRKGSLYHNFQKHLVTTLRLHVNLGSQRRSGDAGEQLVASLWEYFIKSSRPTKRFLYSLLMNIPQNIIQLKNKYRDQQFQDHFTQLLAQATPGHIRQAQQQLRYQLLRQAKKIVQDGHLDARRMHKIQEFKDYFNRFIVDLQKGELNLRLPKHDKNQRRDTQQLRQEDSSEHQE